MIDNHIIQPHPVHPRLQALAERLGVSPLPEKSEERVGASIWVACGPNGSAPRYALEDIANAVLDRLEEVV